jgi:GT2 family glycosyltransferase
MQHTIQNLAILIATKDRLNQLQNLLDSICQSSNLPNKVVIVYSGKDITSVANSFQKKINLELIYSPVASQMYQKSIGIKAVGNTNQWVLFLDDDVVLEVDTIEELYSEYLANPIFKDFVGFGLSILNRSTRKISSFTLGILKFLKLYSNAPGSVTKSGHAQSYLDHPVEIEVKWLNGISVWRSEVLFEYSVIQTDNTYSAYEDVNFSYRVSKNNRLLFAPKAKVVNQSIEGQTPLTINQFVYGGYLRYKFVFANVELSKWWLLVAQLIRGLDFIFRSNENSKIIERIAAASSLWFNLLALVLKNKNIEDLK